MRRVSLELGGKSAAVILDDADLGQLAKGLRYASFVNNSQACAAQTRILAPASPSLITKPSPAVWGRGLLPTG